MRLSGVDPGIIRELSGIYKPFVKAFKELISNAFDADAQRIEVTLHDNLTTLDVLDDGIGMTPYGFHEDFARLGGSTAWLRGGKSPGGRPRIGYKGIGFLAVARYCGALQVETYSRRPYKAVRDLTRGRRKLIPLEDLIGDVVTPSSICDRVTVTDLRAATDSDETILKSGHDYSADLHGIRLISKRALASERLLASIEIDCSHVRLLAELDFDYLLRLERRADLRSLDNFCTIRLEAASTDLAPYTRVRLHKLKDFVTRDLAAGKVKGKARSIVFKSGREQFIWRLARASPIHDDLPADVASPVRRAARLQDTPDLPKLLVKWRNDSPETLTRPIYLPSESATLLEESVFPVDIDEGGLRVIGYILARSEVIYPAELRGISIRVRNVAIGDPSYLGWENILSGPRKAALSQITGELQVLKGLDASDAINPGRESFYEENMHYRILRRALFGSEETVGGIVGKAIASILERIRVRSQVTDALNAAKMRRGAFLHISNAVAFYSSSHDTAAKGFADFFAQPTRADGLRSAKDVTLRPMHKLGGFEVESRKDLGSEVTIDFARRRVSLDFGRDIWDTTLYLGGHYYNVLLKQGRPEHPICEFDNEERKVFVNWSHPVKMHMDDASFLRSSILLRLAHHALPHNADDMMSLAMNMMAFRAE